MRGRFQKYSNIAHLEYNTGHCQLIRFLDKAGAVFFCGKYGVSGEPDAQGVFTPVLVLHAISGERGDVR